MPLGDSQSKLTIAISPTILFLPTKILDNPPTVLLTLTPILDRVTTTSLLVTMTLDRVTTSLLLVPMILDSNLFACPTSSSITVNREACG